MRIQVPVAVAAFLALLSSGMAWGASLQVAPVLVEVAAPGAAATLKLRNEGTTPIHAQIRVFRWSQVNGQEKLEPTHDVVASPPIATLSPRADYTVRLVRVNKAPVAHEESYRLMVDELPNGAGPRNRTVNLVLRYSIPVFFYPRDGAPAKLEWSVMQTGGKLYVEAKNSGDRHVRISALNLRDEHGSSVSFGRGLTGYVLGQSSMRWTFPPKHGPLNTARPILVSAQGDLGPISGSASSSR
jgi:fimbrial chaperone protein